MSQKLTQMMAIVQRDPAVHGVVGFTGAGGGGGASQTNTGSVFVSLKDQSERDSMDGDHRGCGASCRACPAAG